ncbi:hypothetical protein NQZ68_026555 [Dissostichus eleginoides]|nr:hypothetical protein NQZ68_026555 [Dissostichus eleginoides]
MPKAFEPSRSEYGIQWVSRSFVGDSADNTLKQRQLQVREKGEGGNERKKEAEKGIVGGGNMKMMKESNNNKRFLLFEADRITFPPTLNLPPFHCPSASYKSRLSSADMPLKFRNARMGFEARLEPAPGRNPKFPSASYCMPVFVTTCLSAFLFYLQSCRPIYSTY